MILKTFKSFGQNKRDSLFRFVKCLEDINLINTGRKIVHIRLIISTESYNSQVVSYDSEVVLCVM